MKKLNSNGPTCEIWAKYMIYLMPILLLLILPQLQLGQYVMHVFIMIGIYIILASGLNLITGYTGQLSLGHAAFYGIGAYTSAILTTNLGLSFWIATPLGGLIAAIFGLALGFPALRLRGPYLVIATLGFGEIIRQVAINWVSLTKGPMGITGIPAPDPINLILTSINFDTKKTYYYLVLIIVIVFLILINNLINSRTGRAMISVREDGIAAEVMGINIAYYKIAAFVMGSFMAGLAGGLYAHYIRFISPCSLILSESVNMLVMVVVGGMGTLFGPVIGAAVMTFLVEYFRTFEEYRMIIYGIIMFLMVVYVPGGLVGIYKPIHAKISAIFKRKGDF